MPLSNEVLEAAQDLVSTGFALADAIHLAAARKLAVDVFLTVDDRLLKRAKRLTQRIGIPVVDPITFLQEFEHDNDR